MRAHREPHHRRRIVIGPGRVKTSRVATPRFSRRCPHVQALGGAPFFGGAQACPDGVLEDAALLLAALLDDGLLASVEGGAVGGDGGEVVHLVEEGGILEEQSLVGRADFDRDELA